LIIFLCVPCRKGCGFVTPTNLKTYTSASLFCWGRTECKKNIFCTKFRPLSWVWAIRIFSAKDRHQFGKQNRIEPGNSDVSFRGKNGLFTPTHPPKSMDGGLDRGDSGHSGLVAWQKYQLEEIQGRGHDFLSHLTSPPQKFGEMEWGESSGANPLLHQPSTPTQSKNFRVYPFIQNRSHTAKSITRWNSHTKRSFFAAQ
jgi:hypothetical protein